MAFFAPLMAMRFIVAVCVMALTFGRACAGPLPEEIVARQIHAIVPSDDAGGVAVVLRLGGRTSFFNYGWADRVNEKPVTTDRCSTWLRCAKCLMPRCWLARFAMAR